MSAGLRRWFWVQVANWCHVFRQRETALRFFGLALQAAPGDPRILASMGFELLLDGRKREALAMFDRVVAAMRCLHPAADARPGLRPRATP